MGLTPSPFQGHILREYPIRRVGGGPQSSPQTSCSLLCVHSAADTALAPGEVQVTGPCLTELTLIQEAQTWNRSPRGDMGTPLCGGPRLGVLQEGKVCSCGPDRLETYHQVDELTRHRAGWCRTASPPCPKPSALASGFRSHPCHTPFACGLLCPLHSK